MLPFTCWESDGRNVWDRASMPGAERRRGVASVCGESAATIESDAAEGIYITWVSPRALRLYGVCAARPASSEQCACGMWIGRGSSACGGSQTQVSRVCSILWIPDRDRLSCGATASQMSKIFVQSRLYGFRSLDTRDASVRRTATGSAAGPQSRQSIPVEWRLRPEIKTVKP